MLPVAHRHKYLTTTRPFILEDIVPVKSRYLHYLSELFLT